MLTARATLLSCSYADSAPQAMFNNELDCRVRCHIYQSNQCHLQTFPKKGQYRLHYSEVFADCARCVLVRLHPKPCDCVHVSAPRLNGLPRYGLAGTRCYMFAPYQLVQRMRRLRSLTRFVFEAGNQCRRVRKNRAQCLLYQDVHVLSLLLSQRRLCVLGKILELRLGHRSLRKVEGAELPSTPSGKSKD
jgi:hypothetical protein